MSSVLTNRKWLPVWWFILALVILAADFISGPEIAFTYLFLFPVALAARFNGRWLGIAFAVVLPVCRFCFHFFWESSWDWSDILFNLLICVAVLVCMAILIDRVTRQSREIRVLKGFLPICSFCKKIRVDDQKWQQMEIYIAERSEARFTHTFCPECAKKHYGVSLASQKSDSEASPK